MHIPESFELNFAKAVRYELARHFLLRPEVLDAMTRMVVAEAIRTLQALLAPK